MASVPQKELRNNIGEVLRRAESGEEITITVSGRAVAQLGPARTRQWVAPAQLTELWRVPGDPTLEKDLETLDGEVTDPWRAA
jgi:prevent-host-death family protein